MSHDENDSGFISHLTELRKRLINSFIFLIIFFIACYFFAEHLYGFLVEPYAQAVKDDNIDIITRVEERDELDKRKALYNQAVKKLEPRELEILTARRLDEEPKTLEDLSQKYSISRERVRQIENKAIKKLQEEIKLISETKLLPKN